LPYENHLDPPFGDCTAASFSSGGRGSVEARHQRLEGEGYAADNLAHTFDQDALTNPATIGVTDYAIHPDAFALKSYPLDMAVLTLASPVVGIDPLELPEPGFLSAAAAQAGCADTASCKSDTAGCRMTEAAPKESRRPGCGYKPHRPSPD
jgi:hypothetical protein